MKTLVYPRLPAVSDFIFIRFRGSGLANCLFIVARAFVISQRNDWPLINPTWGNISFGPYLRREKDKRHYFGLFKKTGITGISRIFYLLFYKKINYDNALSGTKGIISIGGLGNYFQDFLHEHFKVKSFLYLIFRDEIIINIENIEFSNIIGIHVRLGDYTNDRRKEISWYVEILNKIESVKSGQYTFFVFSDGLDNELGELLQISQVQRVFFGNALSDLIALSKCKLIIGSDSTFSGWAAFLEQTPIIFPHKHFGKVLNNSNHEFIENGDSEKLKNFLKNII